MHQANGRPTGRPFSLPEPSPSGYARLMSAYNELQLSSYVDQIFKRLSAVEAQLAVLSERAGVAYERPGADAPPEVAELVAAGNRIGAIAKYRELTGAGLQEAQEVVAGL